MRSRRPKFRPRSIYDVFAVLALVVAMGGTGAYAANEWNSSNIQDETLTGADIKGKPGAPFAPAVDGSLTGHDISGQTANPGSGTPFVDGSLTNADIRNGTITSADVADNSLLGDDIVNRTIGSADILLDAIDTRHIAQGGVGGSDIADGNLKDEDVGKTTFVNFAANIPTVPAHLCLSAKITGTSAAEGDHLLLTASDFDSPALADANLVYSVRYARGTQPDPELWFCNPTNGSVPGGTTHFSLLVIDAQ